MSHRSEQKSPKELECACKVYNVFKVNDMDNSFIADFVIILAWTDPELIGQAKGSKTDWSRDDVPAFQIKNTISLDVDGGENLEDNKPELLNDQGLVTYTIRYRGTFYEHLELEQFPFDSQDLTLVVYTRKFRGRRLKLVPHKTVQNERDSFTNAEWNVLPKIETHCHDVSQISFVMEAQRNASSYMFNIGFLMFLVSNTAFIAFGFKPDQLNERSAVSLMVVLTAVTFKLAVAGSLPKIGYLTLLDKYLLGSFVFMCGLCFQHLWVSTYADDMDVARIMDRQLFWLALSIWTSFHIFVAWVLVVKERDRRAIRKAWMVHDKPGVSRSVSFYHSGVRLGEAPSVAKLPPLMALAQLKPLAPAALVDDTLTASGKPALLAGVGQPRKRGNLRLDEVAAEEASTSSTATTPSSSSTNLAPAFVMSPASPGPFAQPSFAANKEE